MSYGFDKHRIDMRKDRNLYSDMCSRMCPVSERDIAALFFVYFILYLPLLYFLYRFSASRSFVIMDIAYTI